MTSMGTKAGLPALTIAVLGSKGGVGKTTLATNLAAASHLDGRRTILLDCDTQGSSLDWFGGRGEGSRLAGLPTVKVDKALTLTKIRAVADGYSVVLLDGPPRLGDVTRAAAVAADLVLVPIRPGAFDYWSLDETGRLLDGADTIRAELGMSPLRRLVVVNGAPVRGRATAEILDAVRSAQIPTADTVVVSRVAYARASAGGEGVLTSEPGSAAALEIAALWAEVLLVARGGSHVG